MAVSRLSDLPRVIMSQGTLVPEIHACGGHAPMKGLTVKIQQEWGHMCWVMGRGPLLYEWEWEDKHM